MVKVDFLGRLGNVLFEYCVGRIIAEELGYSLEVSLSLDNCLSFFKNATEIDGEKYSGSTEVFRDHIIDLNEIINNKENRKIILNGYFQRYEYVKNYKDKIKNWLFLDHKDFLVPNEDDLVIHVRGGDLYAYNRIDRCPHQNAPALPVSYYKNIIDKIEHKNLYIVTECKEDIVAQKINEIYKNSKIINQSIIEDYYFIYKSKKTILSLSTFSWWASWLSDATEIHFPLTGYWHPNSNHGGIKPIVDEERYKYYDLGVKDNWTSSNDEINKLLVF